MKAKLFTFGFVIISMFAASQEYHKLIRPNTYWDEYSIYNDICWTSVGRYFFGGQDTTINGHIYNILSIHPYLPPGPPWCGPFSISQDSFLTDIFLREDTLAEKVYIYDYANIGGPIDKLIYDFSLQPGDTLQTDFHSWAGPFILDTIEDIELANGEVRRKYLFENWDPWITNYIESIGGSNGLFLPIFIFEGSGGYFCVKENSENIWGNMCDQWFYVNTENLEISNAKIFPNPTYGLITVSLPKGVINCSLTIFNSSGQIIRTIPIQSETTEVNLTGFAPGLYVYQIANEAKVITGKLAIF